MRTQVQNLSSAKAADVAPAFTPVKHIVLNAGWHVQERAAADIEEIRSQYRQSVAAVLQLAERDLVELRTYSSPPPAVVQVLVAVCTVLGLPADWDSALTLMNHSDVALVEHIRAFDVVSMRGARLVKLQALLQCAEVQPGRVAAVSAAAHSLALWVRAVAAHGKTDDIRRHARRATRAVLDDSSASQVRLRRGVPSHSAAPAIL